MSKPPIQIQERLLRYAVNNGISVVIVFFLLFLGYRYFEMRMAQMATEFHESLNLVGYNIQGKLTGLKPDESRPVDFNIQLTKIHQWPSKDHPKEK